MRPQIRAPVAVVDRAEVMTEMAKTQAAEETVDPASCM